MTIAVVIIAAGREEHLARVLDGLDHQHRRPDDVVVVDMAPDCSATATVAVAGAGRIVASPARPGAGLALAAARNAGAAATAPADIVFLDVDCIPSAGLVATYEQALRRYPRVLACAPVRYLREDWLRGLPARCWPVEDPAALGRLSEPHPARPDVRPGDVRMADDHHLFWSLSFATARETWDRLGGFDERYEGYGGEDTDFAYRARCCGIRLAWLGDGVAYHQWHAPARDDPQRVPEIVANAITFRRRWGEWPMRGWLDQLRADGHVHFDADRDELWMERDR